MSGPPKAPVAETTSPGGHPALAHFTDQYVLNRLHGTYPISRWDSVAFADEARARGIWG